MVSEQVRQALWRDEVAGVQAAISRAAEIQAHAPPGSRDARQATAEALRAYRTLVQQLQRDPDLQAQTPTDLVRTAVADGVARAGRIEARSREVARGKDAGIAW